LGIVHSAIVSVLAGLLYKFPGFVLKVEQGR